MDSNESDQARHLWVLFILGYKLILVGITCCSLGIKDISDMEQIPVLF